MSTVGPDLPPLSPARGLLHALSSRGDLIPILTEPTADLRAPLSAFLRRPRGAGANTVGGGEPPPDPARA